MFDKMVFDTSLPGLGRPFDTYFNDIMNLSHCAVDILPRADIGFFEKILFLCSHEHNGKITHLLLQT